MRVISFYSAFLRQGCKKHAAFLDEFSAAKIIGEIVRMRSHGTKVSPLDFHHSVAPQNCGSSVQWAEQFAGAALSCRRYGQAEAAPPSPPSVSRIAARKKVTRPCTLP